MKLNLRALFLVWMVIPLVGVMGGSAHLSHAATSPSPPKIRVPSVIGKDKDEAVAILTRAGLRMREVFLRYTGRARPSTVIDQWPPKDALVEVE